MNLQQVVEQAAKSEKTIVAVAAAHDQEVLEAVVQAIALQIADFKLYGDHDAIEQMLGSMADDRVKEHVIIIPCKTAEEASQMAVKAVHDHEAHVLMKGNVPTATILKAVLNKEYGLRSSTVLSHVAAFEVPGYDRLIYVSDAAMNIAPDLNQKAGIIVNAVKTAKKMGVEVPNVSCLAAVETVNSAMQATLDAAELVKMNKEGILADCIVEGPLALDISISEHAAAHKGIKSEVAGRADILVVPTIEAGNVLYKSLVYFAGAKAAAIIAGAKAPIVLTSRADSAETKLYSLAMAVVCSQKK
ncbi:phosphate butyryltransferase [Bacillus testis]|uniref:phosphate butyryltransferase n=1 Tax=Bacillus testis TaxID=1622072 RepID=UPI00067F2543|nr:phosphate butyryltransferase [Bacillus testis]